MRLTCPECAAEYDVPDAALAEARRLRCSACGVSWDRAAQQPARPEPSGTTPPTEASPPPERRPEPAPEAVSAKVPQPEAPPIAVVPERRIAAAAASPDPGHGAGLAWTASLVILLAAIAALYVWRAPVMAAWPPAVRLYAALGLG